MKRQVTKVVEKTGEDPLGYIDYCPVENSPENYSHCGVKSDVSESCAIGMINET
jgi:hypothetical protein